ncbi:MAG TPA: 6-pyruvoyl tetrahydropterin synthase family protein [Ktedonobacterales bacterium]|nr:6-pyruvoyl tetrahydropterin synthase family protein [Ktedonobacterales bacterium]
MNVDKAGRERAGETVQDASGGTRMTWSIVIERGNLGFSAAHFITYEGRCEPLHGHNYGVRVEAAGNLTPDSLVVDFIAFKNVVRDLCKTWDHRFLLPLESPHLRVAEREGSWEITFDAATRYVLPATSVVALPIDNATTERLAELLARRIVEALRARNMTGTLSRLTVGVEETEMQTAFYTLDLAADEQSGQPGAT